MTYLHTFLVGLLLVLLCPEISGKTKRPHILLLVLDDVGWADHTVYVGKKGTNIPTPELEKFAKSGIALSNYYTQTGKRIQSIGHSKI